MDAEIKIDANDESPWPDEIIDENQIVYRQIIASRRTGERPKKYPPEGHFSLREGEDSLSFNWDKHIDVPKNFKLISLTANSKGGLLDFTGFTIYKYQVGFLKSIDKFDKIVYKPKYYGLPSPVGQPNNKSHALLFYETNDNGVRVALSDYCLDNIDFCKCEFDVKTLNEEIAELRSRENDTPYHKLWEFEE